MQRRIALVILALLVASTSPTATASPAVPARLQWLVQGSDPVAALDALRLHPDKVPAEFSRHLSWASSGGLLRAMVALSARNPQIESFVEGVTRHADWYGEGARFFGIIDQQGFAELLRHPAVSLVEPDHPISFHLALSVPDVNARGANGIWGFDSTAGSMGGLNSLSYGLGTDAVTGKGVTLAIVDSGIDRTHRDFGGWDCEADTYQPCESRIVEAVMIDQVQGVPDDPGDSLPTTEIASGHGTHVAGIAAGNGYYARATGGTGQSTYGGDGYVIGMAPQASLVSVKVGDGPSAALATDALQWTLENAERLRIRVANNSWGCSGGCEYNPTSVLSQIQRDLYANDVVTVFSAGNSGDASGVERTGEQGTGAGLNGRSQSPYVLSIAAYDHQTQRLASFSSRGAPGSSLEDPGRWTPEGEQSNPPRRPDLAAPGVWISAAASLTPGAGWPAPRINAEDVNQGYTDAFAYGVHSGTSMAAPHVSGAAALLTSACPTARALDVMRALIAGAARSKILKTDGSAVAEAREVGYGGLDVRASLNWMMARPPCNGDDIWDSPVAGITAPSFSAVGHVVDLDASSSYDPDGQVVAYEWNFGDGAPDEFEKEAIHLFQEPGAYVVTLNVTDNDGITASATHQIVIYDSLGSIIGRVTSAGKGVRNALIACDQAGDRVANKKGWFFFEDVAPVPNRCTASARGFRSQTKEFTVASDKPTEVAFKLKKDRG